MSTRADEQVRADIVEVGRRLYTRGFVASNDGNISARLDDHRLVTTPKSVSKGFMTPDMMVIVDYEGRKVTGDRDPSSELPMHLEIYRNRPDVNAVVHAHPPTATGFAAAGVALNQPLVCEVVIGLGSIPLAKYGTPGTPELTDALAPLVPNYDALLMSNHGVVTYGTDLSQAFMKMETVEHFARIALVTHQLGRQQPLAGEDLEKLVGVREKYLGGTQPIVPEPAGSKNGNKRKRTADGVEAVTEDLRRRRISQ